MCVFTQCIRPMTSNEVQAATLADARNGQLESMSVMYA